jgi:HisA/HisF family protein
LKIIPVLDVKDGRAVHAVAGRRDDYRELRSVLHPDADPVALARAIRDTLGAREIYLADLDAIEGREPNRAVVERVHELGPRLWLDVGLTAAADARSWRGLASASLIAGTETLDGIHALEGLLSLLGPERLILSLDLRGGRLLARSTADWPDRDPLALWSAAWERGVRRVLVLDLERVGLGGGVGTLPVLDAIRRRSGSGVELAAGGGVAGVDDLAGLERLGVDAALVGSAIHEGRVGSDRIR